MITKPFKSNITAVFGGWTNRPSSDQAILSCEIARTLSFIYGRFDGNSLADIYVGEKHVGLDKRQASQKENDYVLSQSLNFIPAPFSALDSIFCRLDPIAVASTFGHLSGACSPITVFSFLVRFFELAHGHFHGLSLFIPKELHQGRCLEPRFLRQYLVFFNFFLKNKDHISTNILTQKSSFEENYLSEGIL